MLSKRTYLLLLLSWILSGADQAYAEQPRKKTEPAPASEKSKQTAQPDQAAIERLIKRLGSDSFADREEAMKELRSLGKPALEALRTAAANSDDKEVRRRAGEFVTQLLEPPHSKLFKEGVRQLEQKKDYRKAAALLKQAAELYENDSTIPRAKKGRTDQPILAEIYLHLARAHRGLEEYEKAGRAYHGAVYSYSYNEEKHQQIDREWSAMIDALLRDYEKIVKAKIDKDAALKALTSKYPFVVLHSRRFAGGSYLKSAYSFIDETADESKRRNAVLVLFDNGSGESTFEINTTVGQHNLIVDLGDVDFTKDPDPKKVDPNSDHFWMPDGKAIEGHVYLERVRDSDGNKFYVVMKVIAADKDSHYMAFIWRLLPGGKVVKHP